MADKRMVTSMQHFCYSRFTSLTWARSAGVWCCPALAPPAAPALPLAASLAHRVHGLGNRGSGFGFGIGVLEILEQGCGVTWSHKGAALEEARVDGRGAVVEGGIVVAGDEDEVVVVRFDRQHRTAPQQRQLWWARFE